MSRFRISSLLAGCAVCACAPQHAADLTKSTRFVSSPTSIVALSATSDSKALPGAITFGGSHGRSALYLKFPPDFAAHGVPLKAFIALSPRADAAPDATPSVVEAWRVNAAWQASELSEWSDKPPLAPPYAAEKITSSPARDLRIDVTELARFAAQNPSRDFGFALLGRSGAGHGASFATGVDTGTAPRLEIYVR